MTTEEIEQRYQEFCQTESDINQHLPTLRKYYDECGHVTELGVRGCVSLFAALASKASKVVAYDIFDVWTPAVDKLTFICADDLLVTIEPTDFLFIDTKHCYEQCIKELALHGNKSRKYIGFHDTAAGTFGLHGDDGKEGLLLAIERFMHYNPHWVHEYHEEKNNGLTIIKRT